MDVVWVDKIEVTRRQIKAAVRLFFENGLPDGPIKQMQQVGIEKWEFKEIRQLLELAEVVGDLPLTNNL